MERPTHGKKWIWWVLVPVLALALLISAVLILGSGGVSARYDDAEKILFAYDPAAYDGVELQPDGSVTLRLGKEDLYWFGEKYGVLPRLRQEIAEQGGKGNTGFRISGGSLTVYHRVRLLGLIPVSCRAEMELTLSPDGSEVVLRAKKVSLGRRLPLPERFWPELFENGLTVPMSWAGRGIRSVALEGDEIVIELDGLRTAPEAALTLDTDRLTVLETLLPPERLSGGVLDFLRALETPEFAAAEAWEVILSGEDAAEALSELLSFCREDGRSLWQSSDTLLRRTVSEEIRRRTEERRAWWDEQRENAQLQYERLLMAPRDLVKSGGALFAENALLNAATGLPLDPAEICRLPVTATDCRVVVVYCASGSEELRPDDMPILWQVPRTSRETLTAYFDREMAYDLAVALTTEGGVPVLLYRRGDGAFVMRELDNGAYVSVLVSQRLPMLDLDSLPAPAREISLNAGERWTAAVMLLLDGE